MFCIFSYKWKLSFKIQFLCITEVFERKNTWNFKRKIQQPKCSRIFLSKSAHTSLSFSSISFYICNTTDNHSIVLQRPKNILSGEMKVDRSHCSAVVYTRPCASRQLKYSRRFRAASQPYTRQHSFLSLEISLPKKLRVLNNFKHCFLELIIFQDKHFV